LYGLRASKKPADKEHPFGHGKEQFFWSFIVAMILFGIAGTLSIVEGYHKFHHPEPIKHIGLTYLAIAVALLFDGFAIRIAYLNIKEEQRREKHRSFLETLRKSKDPTNLTVFVEDSLAICGVLIAGVAITVVHFTGILVIDAIASIVIGVMLMVFALFLAFETRMLLVGESVTSYRRKKILKIVRSFEEVVEILSLKTMHLSSDEVLVALEIDYRDDMVVGDLEKINLDIEAKIKEIIPYAKVYLEAQKKPPHR
jgi:cation diffusion facilitator family transporter